MQEAMTTLVKVRFGDCDPIGHLNNVKYLEYMLNAREDHVENNYGFTYAGYARETGCTWIAVKNKIAYLKEVTANTTVQISSHTISVSGRTADVEILMKDETGTVTHAVLWTSVIYFNFKTRKSEEQPMHIRELYKDHIALIKEIDFDARAEYLRKQNKIS